MKKIIYLLVTVLLIGGFLVLLTGCGKTALTTVTFTNPDPAASISLSYEEGSPYKFINGETEGKTEFRTSREDASIIGDDFQIGFEVDEYFGTETFDELKEEAKTKDQFKEVKYNGISGYSRFYDSYYRYEVYLPINDEAFLRLTIYSGTKANPGDTNEQAKATFESEKMQNILNTIEIN